MAFKKSLLIFTLSAAATFSGDILAMKELCFQLDNERHIQSYFSSDMSFYEAPDKFEGKDIVEVLPLSDNAREAILKSFDTATKESKVTEVIYSLVGKEDEEFVAQITPLKSQKFGSYFVKVWAK